MVSAIYDKDGRLIKYIDNQWVYEDGTPIDDKLEYVAYECIDCGNTIIVKSSCYKLDGCTCSMCGGRPVSRPYIFVGVDLASVKHG